MIKKISHIICLILLFLVCRFAITNAIEKPLIGDLSHSMPAASYVYMAFNEEEFGFQDGTHDINRTFSDVADRLAGYIAYPVLPGFQCRMATIAGQFHAHSVSVFIYPDNPYVFQEKSKQI